MCEVPLRVSPSQEKLLLARLEAARQLYNAWSNALVMVGKAVIEGKRSKIATIPIELRQPLKEILEIT